MIQKEFDDPQVFDDPNGSSTESVDFDNPIVCVTSVFGGFVYLQPV